MRQGFYQWANDVLIPNLYYTVNYNGESSSSYDEGYIADMYSWRLGPPKIRQLRVERGKFYIGLHTVAAIYIPAGYSLRPVENMKERNIGEMLLR